MVASGRHRFRGHADDTGGRSQPTQKSRPVLPERHGHKRDDEHLEQAHRTDRFRYTAPTRSVVSPAIPMSVGNRDTSRATDLTSCRDGEVSLWARHSQTP